MWKPAFLGFPHLCRRLPQKGYTPVIPSSKRLHNYGKSPCLVNYLHWLFSIAVLVYPSDLWLFIHFFSPSPAVRPSRESSCVALGRAPTLPPVVNFQNMPGMQIFIPPGGQGFWVYNVVPPSNVCWFINPINTIVISGISTINHTLW